MSMAFQLLLIVVSCLSLLVSILSVTFLVCKRCCIKYEFYVLLNLVLSDFMAPFMYILLSFVPIVQVFNDSGVRATMSLFIAFTLLSSVNESTVGLKRYLKIKKPLTFCKTYFKKRMIFISMAPWFVVGALIIALCMTGNKDSCFLPSTKELLTQPAHILSYLRALAPPLLLLMITLHILFFTFIAYTHLTIWNTARYHKRSYKSTVKGVQSSKGSVKVLHLYKARRKVILILGSHLMSFLPFLTLEFLIACNVNLNLMTNTDYMPVVCHVAQFSILCRGLLNTFNYVLMDVARRECNMKQLIAFFAPKSKCERTSSTRYYLNPQSTEQPRRSSQQSILTEASYV